jgi:hypothetical protein
LFQDESLVSIQSGKDLYVTESSSSSPASIKKTCPSNESTLIETVECKPDPPQPKPQPSLSIIELCDPNKFTLDLNFKVNENNDRLIANIKQKTKKNDFFQTKKDDNEAETASTLDKLQINDLI